MSDLKELEKRIQQIEEKLGIVHEYPFTFEGIVGDLDHRTLENIWSGLDSNRIAVALIGLNSDQLKNAKATFSKARWNEIAKELGEPSMKEITTSNVRASREAILDKVIKLDRMGEIVVSRTDAEGHILLNLGVEKSKEPVVDVSGWVQAVFEKV